MSYKYFPHTDDDLQQMMSVCGISSLDELYADVPEALRFRGEYNLPLGMSEEEVRTVFASLASANRTLTCFAGAGVYDHYVPSVIPQLLSRSELLTSYTPYQAEISQGTLHYTFEYQSMMAGLTGMDISNASMYDGATATAEALMMAVSAGKGQRRVLVSETIDPKVMAVITTYARFHDIEIDTLAATDGAVTLDALAAKLATAASPYAAVLVQQPNFFGILEDYSGFADAIHQSKGLFIVSGPAAPLAMLRTPGEWGADIAVGDGQSLGIPMQWGGPYVGYLCATEKLMRRMPGRIVGRTVDNRGQRAFVLTLQAREQHIRRQKATSNICSNQSLMALWATVYMSLMGPQGMREAAQLSYDGAHYLCDRLTATGHFQLVHQRPFFNEFLVSYDGDAEALQRRWAEEGFLGGVAVEPGKLLFAVTERRTKAEADRLVSIATEQG